jgi:competence protein ComFB
MEFLVVQKLEDVWETLDCCKCDKCRNDIIALTLNQLPAKYVVTKEGELYARLAELSNEEEREILIALAKSAKLVKAHPKHEDI